MCGLLFFVCHVCSLCTCGLLFFFFVTHVCYVRVVSCGCVGLSGRVRDGSLEVSAFVVVATIGVTVVLETAVKALPV